MSVEYYYMNDLNTLYNASVGDKTDGGEHHMKMMVAHDNLEAYMQKMEHWRDTALQLSRNNGEAQAKINALEADYVISNRELLVKQVEIQGLTARIAELEAAQRWIPVSERLPEPYTRVLACIKSGYMEVDYMYSEPIVDVGIADFNSLDNVTHWMPLPPSPESEVK